MPVMQISVPDKMKIWIDGKAESGHYVDSADYLRDLVRRDQERWSRIEAMQAHVDEGLASGISDESMEDILVSSKTRPD